MIKSRNSPALKFQAVLKNLAKSLGGTFLPHPVVSTLTTLFLLQYTIVGIDLLALNVFFAIDLRACLLACMHSCAYSATMCAHLFVDRVDDWRLEKHVPEAV